MSVGAGGNPSDPLVRFPQFLERETTHIMTSGLIALIAAPVIGAVLGVTVMFGVVAVKTATPDKNPANQSSLTYGQ